MPFVYPSLSHGNHCCRPLSMGTSVFTFSFHSSQIYLSLAVIMYYICVTITFLWSYMKYKSFEYISFRKFQTINKSEWLIDCLLLILQITFLSVYIDTKFRSYITKITYHMKSENKNWAQIRQDASYIMRAYRTVVNRIENKRRKTYVHL